MDIEASYRVVIDCPATGREIDTGLSMSRKAFAHPAVTHSAVAHCPYCGQRHGFDLKDARLKVDD